MKHNYNLFRRKAIACLAFILAMACSETSVSQLVINPGGTPATIINNLIGAGLTVSNVQLVCGPSGPTAQYGTFNGSASNIGLPNGVILTTGQASNAVGPNNTNFASACPFGNMTPDPQLSTIDPQATRDICKLEFDVIPHCQSLTLRFVFGSEEYPEYVNTIFNDAFGFFVTGPGGPSCTPNFFNNTNVAVLPSGTPVSINNINNGYAPGCNNPTGPCTNCAFYVNNCGGATVQYDGFTTAIQLNLSVCACSTYHWKFIIGDVGDCAYDSGVLLDYLNSCNSPLAYTVATTAAACGCNGSATVNITTGVPPYSYLWSNGDTNQTATGLCPGIYTVSVMDAISCNTPVVQNVIIGGSSTPVIGQVSSVTNVLCGGDSTGDATVFATSGAAPFTYAWSNGDTNQTATGLPAGNYTVIITDVNGCADTLQVTITEPPAINIAFNTFSHTTCANNNGSISPTYTGGTGTLSYLWSNNQNTASINNLAPGTYTVTVTDANNCVASSSFTINPSTVPVLSSSPDTTICSGDAITLTVTGATTYAWTPGTGLSSTTGSSVTANPLVSTYYQIVGSDPLGCTDTAYINLTVNALPVMAVSPPSASICQGDSTSLAANGATTYSWSPTSGLDNPANPVVNASPAQTTIYTVTGDILGCTSTAQITVTVDTVPVVAFTPISDSSCAPLAVQFTDVSPVVPGNSVYHWQFGDGSTSSQQNPFYTYNTAGSYIVTLTLTSPAGCIGSASSQPMTAFPDPVADFYVAPKISTLGMQVFFTDLSQPQPIGTWHWDFGDGVGTSSMPNPIYTYTDTGTYSVTLVVTTLGNCTDSITYGVLVRDDIFTLYVPNVFTPNGDGHNDLFIATGIYEKISVYVYNRWGEEVFHTTNVNDAWNGKFRDHRKDCPSGTYVYMIDAWDVYDRVHHFVGKISLIR